MKTRDYELILNALKMTGIYVIREEDHGILYYNQRVKEIAPNVQNGMSCHELLAGSCSNCPLLGIGNKKTNHTISYDNPFGKAVDITATRILWEDTIPAFVITIDPHAEITSYAYHKILRCNLTLDTFEVIKVLEEEKKYIASGNSRLSVWLEMFAKSGAVYEEDVERFCRFVDFAHLKKELGSGRTMLACNYRRKSPSGYRWNTMEIIADLDYSDKNQTIMLYVKDVHDIYQEGLEHEELNLKNEAILKALGEVNFGIYMIGLDTGYMNPVRVAEADRDFINGRNRDWDQIMEELLSRRYHPDYWTKFREAFSLNALREARDNRKEKEALIALRTIDGSYHYVSASASFYVNERGKDYVVMAFQDVDERIRREIEYAQNDRRMAAIIKSRYSVMNTVHLESGICERVNLEEADLDDQIQKGDYTYFVEKAANEEVHEADKEAFLSMLSLENLREKAVDVEDYEELIFEYRIKGSPVRWLEEHILFIRQETGVIVNILGRDITGKKLKEEEENLAAIEKANIINCLSSLFFAAYYVDLKEGTYRPVIRGEDGVQVLGEKKDYAQGLLQYAGKHVRTEHQEEYVEFARLESLINKLTPENPMMAFEFSRQEDETGLSKWTRATIVLSETENGKPKTALYVAQDITKSKKKEERDRRALREACEAANHANASKSEFLSRMSHDIRTPMNAIIGMTAIAGAHMDDRERVADCLGKITVSSRHLLSLINEVLDMSKIEAGKINLVEEEFNLSGLLENVLTILRPAVSAKNHQVELRVFQVEHEAVIGDEMRLQQVFTNILSNAVKYTPNGGRIEIEIIEKTSKVYGYGCYEFVFRDNGIGMSKEYQKQIFEPFTRAEDSRISTIEGTGLGMTIAQNIVRMMNGSIRVESRENHGSQFTVTVFLKQKKTSAMDKTKPEESRISAAETVPSKQRDFSGKRILLVEDNELNREIAEEIIGMTGVAIECAVNGKEAVDMFQRNSEGYYDLIFMDIQMPVMNGLQAAEAIRSMARKDAGSIPIVAMTANAFTEDVQASRRAGMNEHVTKPLDFENLMNCMGRWLYKENN